MVKGLEVFREHFRNYADRYVLIGGAACDIAMTGAGTRIQSHKGPRHRSLHRGFGCRVRPGILAIRPRGRLQGSGEVNRREAVLSFPDTHERGLSFHAGVVLAAARCATGC